MPTPKASTTAFSSTPTWNGRPIIIDTAHVPYSHCAFLGGANVLTGPIGFGHSEEQAVERLIEQLDALEAEELCECDGDDPSVGYVGSVCAYCRGEREPIATRKPAESVVSSPEVAA
jgi:hypothetical protein